MATSSDGRNPTAPTESEVVGLVVGLIAVVTVAAAAVIKWQARRQLREPTKTQRRDIAAPVARILIRRVGIERLTPELGDWLAAAAATGAYVGDGPLLLPLHQAPNLPDDLQESDQ